MIHYQPYSTLDGIPNIVVDGSPHKDSVLVLSHWKGSGTPEQLMRDTSAEIVLDYIVSQNVPPEVRAVSNDHFDQDGLVGIFALLNPEYALVHRDLLIEIAEAGDFAKYKNRNAARVVFTLAKMLDADGGFFSPEIFRLGYPDIAAIFYQKLLPQLPHIIENLNLYESYWREEDQFLSASENLVKIGAVKITETEDPILATVEISPELKNQSFHWANEKKFGLVHDMAIHNITDRSQVLYRQEKIYWFKYRYESWVQFQSIKHPLRVNLTNFCNQLDALEGEKKWTYSGSEALNPVLSCNGESSILFERFKGMLKEALAISPIDWDPFINTHP